jgi:phage head maturation protease
MNTESILHKTLQSTESPPGDATANTRSRWLKMATAAVDRAGDMLVLDGIDTTNFHKNPQFLWQHGASGAMVNTIGKVRILRIIDDALFALVDYDTSPLAEEILRLDTAGLMPANSIGFRPLEWHANDFGGNTFTKWELIECSKVELPMNPEAVDSFASLATESGQRRVESAKSVSAEDAAAWLTN